MAFYYCDYQICVCMFSDLASVEHEIMKTLRHLIIISSVVLNRILILSKDSVDRFTEHEHALPSTIQYRIQADCTKTIELKCNVVNSYAEMREGLLCCSYRSTPSITVVIFSLDDVSILKEDLTRRKDGRLLAL
jgi:hypothetical protein